MQIIVCEFWSPAREETLTKNSQETYLIDDNFLSLLIRRSFVEFLRELHETLFLLSAHGLFGRVVNAGMRQLGLKFANLVDQFVVRLFFVCLRRCHRPHVLLEAHLLRRGIRIISIGACERAVLQSVT